MSSKPEHARLTYELFSSVCFSVHRFASVGVPNEYFIVTSVEVKWNIHIYCITPHHGSYNWDFNYDNCKVHFKMLLLIG